MLAPVATKVSNYTLLETDLQVRGDASGGDFTLTLPSVGIGRIFILRNVGATGKVTLAATSIDGDPTLVLAKKGDVVWVVSLGGGAYETISRSIFSSSDSYDITEIASIGNTYNYIPGFTPRLVLLLHGNAGTSGFGWAVGATTAKQGCYFRAFAGADAKSQVGMIASYAEGYSFFKVNVFGPTVTIQRVVAGPDLTNVVLIAFK